MEKNWRDLIEYSMHADAMRWKVITGTLHFDASHELPPVDVTTLKQLGEKSEEARIIIEKKLLEEFRRIVKEEEEK